MGGRGSAHMARGCPGSFSLVIFHFCLPPPQSRERVHSVWWGVKVNQPPSLGRQGAVTDGRPPPPYLVSPDERLHRQVILHQLVHVGLGLHQGPCSGHSWQGARAQGEWALVGGAWGRSSIGVSEKNVPWLKTKKEYTCHSTAPIGCIFSQKENLSWQVSLCFWQVSLDCVHLPVGWLGQRLHTLDNLLLHSEGGFLRGWVPAFIIPSWWASSPTNPMTHMPSHQNPQGQAPLPHLCVPTASTRAAQDGVIGGLPAPSVPSW